MIVKVLIDRNVFSGCGRFCGKCSARIYNEDLSVNWDGYATEKMKDAMRNKGILARVFGKFFHAHLDEAGEIVLDQVAPRQAW